jgi:hypothetical protein
MEGQESTLSEVADDSEILNTVFLIMKWHYADLYFALKECGFKRITASLLEDVADDVRSQVEDQSIAEGWHVIEYRITANFVSVLKMHQSEGGRCRFDTIECPHFKDGKCLDPMEWNDCPKVYAIEERIIAFEETALKRYSETLPVDDIVACLTPEEREEYDSLKKKIGE